MKLKLTFNEKARLAAIDAFKKLGNFGSPLSLLLAIFFKDFNDKVAIAAASLASFIACHIVVILLAGIEEVAVKKKEDKVSCGKNCKAKTKSNDTS